MLFTNSHFLPSCSQAALFGKKDEAGSSLVYYFALPEGWEPGHVRNPAALGLLQRFLLDQNEQDSQATRLRLKLIPRISNVAEWSTTGPLNSAEHRLLDVSPAAFCITCVLALLRCRLSANHPADCES